MDQSIYSIEQALTKAGFGRDIVSRASDLRNRMYAMARTGKYDDAFATDMDKAHTEPWFKTSALPFPIPTGMSEGERRFLTFEPIPVWEKVRVPVLALWGDADAQVPALKSKDIIESALKRSSDRDVTVRVFPHADHTLSVVRAPTDGWDFPRTAPGSRQLMAEWLLERSGSNNRKGTPAAW